jgi:hypothetical protein
MKTKIISIFKKEIDIRKIITELRDYSFDDLEKHPHFEFSVMEKLTDLNKLKEVFPRFELIKSIELRENERKERYYSINYELEDETFVVISIVLNREMPLLINGFHVKTNYKRFEKSLRKNYEKKFI